MLYGFCPFESTTIPKLIEVLKETELEFPNSPPVSEETKRLVKRLLTKDPTKRIEWMELLKVNITNEGIANDGRGVLSLGVEEGNILDTAKLLQSSKFTPAKDEKNEESQSYSPQSTL
jgi:serine/threonine protein kinase